MTKIHGCTMFNPFGDPPEYLIEGFSSIPVIRTPTTIVTQPESIDARRKGLTLFKLSSCTQEEFNDFLFSSELFYIDFYNENHILKLIHTAVDSSNYNDLSVYLIFAAEKDGGYRLVRKFFKNRHNNNHYIFKNNLSSSFLIMDYPSFSVIDEKTQQSDFYTTIYRFKERLYTKILVNCSQKNRILPLLISYDEFGVVYVEYYYNNKII